MSNYTKSTDFASKDSLPSGNAGKIVKGTEIDTEFNNIATAIATKADTTSPSFSGSATFGAISATSVSASSVTTSSATITGGDISGITDLAVADGGTGASTAADARANLGTVADTASNGIAARTSANTLTARTISAGSGISVSNGDGVSGNPTIANSGVLSVDSQTGAISLGSLAAFASSLGSNGYQKLPGGLIIQWGTTGSISAGGTASVSLPISFPTAHLASVAICASATAVANITSRTTSGLDIRSSGNATTSATWIAIGY